VGLQAGLGRGGAFSRFALEGIGSGAAQIDRARPSIQLERRPWISRRRHLPAANHEDCPCQDYGGDDNRHGQSRIGHCRNMPGSAKDGYPRIKARHIQTDVPPVGQNGCPRQPFRASRQPSPRSHRCVSAVRASARSSLGPA